MSFSSTAKAEICRRPVDSVSCAVAECCGILMYCSAFSPEILRVTTASPEFAERLPKLFLKAFDLTFDAIPPGGDRKRSFTVTDSGRLRHIFDVFGLDPASPAPVHVNFALLEDDRRRAAFVRGAFLAGGSVTDPAKGSHLEFSTSHRTAARETCSILRELGFTPGESSRQGNVLLYFKQPDAIADFLTLIGAPVTSMDVQTARVEREMRNRVTRQINCDSANADRTVSAAQEQITAIRLYASRYGLNNLPDGLRDAALLRITNPEASLADLAKLSSPPVTKSCLSHRLKRILTLVSAPDPDSGTDTDTGTDPDTGTDTGADTDAGMDQIPGE